MDSKAWELVLAIVGSGTVGGFLVWAYNAMKNRCIKDFRADDLFQRVDAIEIRQEDHEDEYRTFKEQMQSEFTSMEKKMSDSNKDMDIRLTTIEID